jgi:16S rRNA (adenine1518-N6/adenine1519-N6)-dimethyltransferase
MSGKNFDDKKSGKWDSNFQNETTAIAPKKHLGQHFLNDKAICERIACSLTFYGDYKDLIEIGPGTGALTEFLVPFKNINLHLMDVDHESIAFLNDNYKDKVKNILHADFLNYDLNKISEGKIGVIGNFPYNISSQILFRVLDFKDRVPEVVGMFQKEVAMRIAEGPGSKDYGIISVLLQAYYDIDYLFTVDEHVFIPPPKVKSGVIRLKRNKVEKLDCDEVLFKKVVKGCFNQRRKMIRNSIRAIAPELKDHPYFTLRPEQLSVAQFVELTKAISAI